jgi:hypothetical protein
MKVTVAAVASLSALALVGCQIDDSPTGPPFALDNVIKEISFQGAHQDERCSKGCRYTSVPDTWYILFCQVKKPDDCFSRKITHAPWKWQVEGTRVTVTWQPRGDWNQFKGVVLTDTKEHMEM